MYKNINAEQARMGLSDADVADRLSITRQSYLQKKKTGNFKLSEVNTLVELFEVPFEYLFAKEEGEAENAE